MNETPLSHLTRVDLVADESRPGEFVSTLDAPFSVKMLWIRGSEPSTSIQHFSIHRRIQNPGPSGIPACFFSQPRAWDSAISGAGQGVRIVLAGPSDKAKISLFGTTHSEEEYGKSLQAREHGIELSGFGLFYGYQPPPCRRCGSLPESVTAPPRRLQSYLGEGGLTYRSLPPNHVLVFETSIPAQLHMLLVDGAEDVEIESLKLGTVMVSGVAPGRPLPSWDPLIIVPGMAARVAFKKPLLARSLRTAMVVSYLDL